MNIDQSSAQQVILTIRTLHQTAIDQRDRGLTSYLIDIFQSIEEETTFQILLPLLTELLRDYEDRAALKIEFLQAQCLETFTRLLNKWTDDQERIVVILRFLTELLVNSENVQHKFLEFGAYEKIFRFLRHVTSPSTDFIDRLLILMTEKSSFQIDPSLSAVDLFVQFVNTDIAKVLIHWIPYLSQNTDRHRIIHSIQIIVSRSLQNKMIACSHGIISAILDIIDDPCSLNILDDKILLDTIFSILEKLTRFSITADEIRQICQLFLQNTPFNKQLLRVLITAAKHDDSETNSISSYFDLQRLNSGIILPVIRRSASNTSSSFHFTFHCWLRLNHEADSYPYNVRRQIYSFHSDTAGLEAFICHSSLIISVGDRRELAYIEIPECDDLIDGAWHSLTIVHAAQRPSLLVAAFQSISTCQLTIYVDGLLKKQVKDFKYIPLINDTISSASIGAPSQRSRSASTNAKSDTQYLTKALTMTIQPFKGLFTSKSHTDLTLRKQTQVTNMQNMTIVEPNSLDNHFGESTSLHGQLASIWVLVETLSETQVKHLHSMGADFCHQIRPMTNEDNSLTVTLLDYLSNRSLLAYHPFACNGQICVDLATCSSLMSGRLNNGSCFRLRSFSQSLLNLGGCPVLYPLLGLFKEQDYIDCTSVENPPNLNSIDAPSTDWIIVRNQSQRNLSDIDNRLISNPIASVLNLLRCVLSSKSMNILSEQMTKHYNVELLAFHLNHVPAFFIDQHLLIAIQQLIECSRLIEITNLLTNQLIQFILLDFGLWVKAKYQVRIAHLQYVAAVIKDDKSYYRTKFGVQFFLDTLREHFSSNDDNADEQKQLRGAVYAILKYYLQRQPRLAEINALLSSISTISTNNDTITRELLEFILSLLDPPSMPTDTTVGLLCEPMMSENLYALLTVKTLSSETKEVVMKIIKYLVGSKRVPQQIRSQLRLETNSVGFGGIITGLAPDQLNVSIVRDILNLIITSDSNTTVDHLNVVLTLCSTGSLDVRYVAMRKLMNCFIANPAVCRAYSKCQGWQETLAQFFVRSRRSASTVIVDQSASLSVSADVFPSASQDQNDDSGRGSTDTMMMHQSEAVATLVPPQVFETSSSPDDPTQERLVRQIDLSPIIDESHHENPPQSFPTPCVSLSSNSISVANSLLIQSRDETPEFLRRHSEDFHGETTPPPSTSISREDLLSFTRNEISNEDSTSVTSNIEPTTPSSISTRTRIISNDDTSILIPGHFNREDGSLLEELTETLVLTIIMILWKGINGSDEDSWISRGQLFSALHYLQRDYEFHIPLVNIERRILELSIETCLNEFKMNGAYHSYDRLYRRRMSDTRKTTTAYENNCRELIKLIDDFLSQSNEAVDRLTDHFVAGIISILDTMLIFEENGTNEQSKASLVSHDEHWTEISLIGLNILLTLLGHSNANYCGQASVRIHSLLHNRPWNGREEAAYLLSHLNKFCSAVQDSNETDHFAYLLPLMKTIIDKSYHLLQMNVQIPNVPLHKATATAWDDFRQYSSSSTSQEWQNFIQRHIEPLAENYRSMSIRPFHMNMKLWWNKCYEMMMIGIHKRNRQTGEEKLKFQNYIVDQWRVRRRSDHQRLIKLAKQRRLHQLHVEHEWKDRQRYYSNERGPWWNRKISTERYWMLSDRENTHRMRCKLVENDEFNKHEEASRLRDNLGVDSIDGSRSLLLDESLTKKSLFIQQEMLHGNSIDEQEFMELINETQSLLLEEQEKMIIGTTCSLITSTSTTEGKLEITNKYIYFFDSTPQNSYRRDFKYPLSWLHDVQLRRYNLRPSALEFFLLNQTNFLINFDKKLRRQIYQKLMSLKLPTMKSVVSSSSINMTPKDILKESKITEKWVNREISNFDYLMMLNTIAGRTYNDLNQYPVFPWIIKDYSSEILNLDDPNIYRDFSKPIGIQNPKHIEEVRLKYESFDDPTGLMKKFHYGSHYSNAASVMHYLIRMEPFTTLHIQLQSGKFDIADRQFHSFQSAWSNIMDSPNDGKELIPEFFYLPELLQNSNRFDLGKLQISHQQVNDVQLPPWAHGSAEEFIRLHRLALESDYVSAHLHQWIDLIFGYKQIGQAAVDALNVFMYCAYEKAVDVDAIEDPVTREAIEGMIQNFGQIPSQLLTEPHPQRLGRAQALLELSSQGKALSMFQNLTHIRAFFVEITPSDDRLCDPITYISIPKNQVRSFMQQGIPDTLVTISVTGVIGNNGWQPYDKSLSHFFTFERDPTLQTERNRHIIAAPFSPSVEINSRLFTVSHDAKYVFSGGHWDWSLRVYSLLKSKIIMSVIHHSDVITCLTLDSTGHILVTGSRDTTCVVWHLSFGENRAMNTSIEPESNSSLLPTVTLYGHTAEVTSLAVSIELDLVVSGSLDGTCNIHTVEHGVYLRTLKLNGDPVVNLKLSDERHIVIQTEKNETHLFLYSINGSFVRMKKLEYPVVDMIVSDQYIVLGVNHSHILDHGKKVTKKEPTSLIAARIIIKDIFEMRTIQTIRLKTQINCLYFTKDFSHLLVGVKDGKLIVLTAESTSARS